MKHFAGSSPYLYMPLPPTPLLSYRVFKLHPASNLSDTIHGSLKNCSVRPNASREEEFEALSYAWGDNTSSSKIELDNNSYLPISANLESFLRYRRQPDQSVTLWIDAICINQHDLRERSSQVQAMWKIYLLASRLSIWLGPPSDDSALAMNALREFTYETTYTKLSSSQEESTAIRCLLRRAWWFRAWIVQEVAFGAIGVKHKNAVVRCGSEHITWVQLVISCARMHVNALNMRQSFPSVDTVLKLDDLASREHDEVTGLSDPYPCQLLRHLAEYRGCLASDPRDKIYAFIGLWIDASATSEKIGANRKTRLTNLHLLSITRLP